MTVDLRPGDNRRSLRRMIAEGEFVDSVVCDPPYGLVSVTKRFGGQNATAAQFGNDGAFQRQSRGMMGKLWDGTGIERDPEFWSLVYQVLKPGGYIIAFSSTRTYHWQAVALEMAGFITHPMFGWLFNTGFPKGHPVDKSIDATLLSGKARPEELRRLAMGDDYEPSGRGRVDYDNGGGSQMNGQTRYDLQTDEAKQWAGWKTGTQSLKPALEPVYFGQKPFSEKTGALNILKHGVGAVNIDACRVGDSGARNNGRKSDSSPIYGDFGSSERVDYGMGRYPANLVHDGSPEVVALFPSQAGAAAPVHTRNGDKFRNTYGAFNGNIDEEGSTFRGDTGSAARFFNSFPHEGPIMCYPKAGKTDRAGSGHATVKPVALMRHYARLITPPGCLVLDPFAGSGTTGQAALAEGMRYILMEAEHEYIRDICRRFDLSVPMATKLWELGQ